jgi:hypothetical protein
VIKNEFDRKDSTLLIFTHLNVIMWQGGNYQKAYAISRIMQYFQIRQPTIIGIAAADRKKHAVFGMSELRKLLRLERTDG